LRPPEPTSNVFQCLLWTEVAHYSMGLVNYLTSDRLIQLSMGGDAQNILSPSILRPDQPVADDKSRVVSRVTQYLCKYWVFFVPLMDVFDERIRYIFHPFLKVFALRLGINDRCIISL